MDSKQALRYREFLRNLRRYHTDLLEEAVKASTAGAPLAPADSACKQGNKPGAATAAKQSLAMLPAASSLLDKVAKDHAGMKRNQAFTTNSHVKITIDVALTSIDKRLSQEFRALDALKASAVAYAAGSCAAGSQQLDAWASLHADAFAGLSKGEQEITQALAALTDCKDTVLVVTPMSPTQIDRAAGGGGTQLRSTHGLSVLAPKRLKLNRHGRTALPLTLTAPTFGTLEIWLARGNTVIIDIHGSMGRGATGLRVNLPRNTSAGNRQLTVTFTPAGAVDPTAKSQLTVRLT